MGGTMHVADMSRGILGANGIVGGGIGLATGAALAAQLDRKAAVAAAFFGDGATAQGVFTEALNLAALWKLPLVLVCENNGWSEYSPTGTVLAGDIADRAAPFGVPAARVDGNDLPLVLAVAGQAVERARRGEGPTLIEARTYRMAGHVEAETGFLAGVSYRTDAEVQSWRARDPIAREAARLQAEGLAVAAQLDAIERSVAAAVEDAVAFAIASEEPPVSQAMEFMFESAEP
jgi:pyruvate dehydrogenase E1 component alpha subunit